MAILNCFYVVEYIFYLCIMDIGLSADRLLCTCCTKLLIIAMLVFAMEFYDIKGMILTVRSLQMLSNFEL